MTHSESGSSDVFDLKRIRRLVELMKEHDLGEIDLHQGPQRIRLRRGIEVPMAPAAPPAAPLAATAAAAPSELEAHVGLIKSPMVGTFYEAASPEAPPFIKVGDHVGPETTVCIIEAMKVFNEIPAEASGKIVAVLVRNGDPVEYGQPLFKLDTSQ